MIRALFFSQKEGRNMTASYTTQDPQESEHSLSETQRSIWRSATLVVPRHNSPDIEHLPTGKLPVANGHRLDNTLQKLEVEHLPTSKLPVANGHRLDNTLQKLEVEDGNAILYRSENFFVRTAYRAGLKQNPLRKPSGEKTAVMPRVMPDQQKRIAASQTRRMPRVALINYVKVKSFPVSEWLEAIVVCIGLMVVLAAHGFNMFNYPHYEQDEGTYLSSAWAITHGQIMAYPYGYGHPPLAWTQFAAWLQLTGGFFTFGTAINSARVLMLLIALGSSFLVYLIARRLTGSHIAGILTMAIFSLSPLSITFQREVLLDNFATFWFLLSLYLLVVSNSRLAYIVPAAISFGIAVLSKEVLLILLPATIYVAWLHTTKFQRKYVLTTFIFAVIAICSGFVLLAILKGELFPYAWHLPWDHHPHLSMLDTLVWQVNRGQVQGSIGKAWNAWIISDPLLIAFGFGPTVFNLIAGWWNRKQLFLALLAISYWILLLRGGVVFAFYILPLIPLIALNTVMAINTIAGWASTLVRFDPVRVILIFGVLAAIGPYDFQHSLTPKNLFTLRPTAVQMEALVWIRNHVQHDAVIIINPNLYTDLHEEGGDGVGEGATYPYANVYWNVALDPEEHETLLKGNWDRIDYIVADSEMLNDIKTYGGQMMIIDEALNHSTLAVKFTGDNYEYIYIYKVVHIYPPPVVLAPSGTGNDMAHWSPQTIPGRIRQLSA